MRDGSYIMSSCNENKQVPITFKNADDSDKHNIERNKSDTKKYILYGCIYITTKQTKLTHSV